MVIDERYGGDGLAALDGLKRQGCRAPAIVLATNPTARLRVRIAAANAELIEKPLLGDELSSAIRDAKGCLTCTNLPDGLKPYKRTPTFTEDSVPTGLLTEHSTKDGVWGLVQVEKGALRYVVTDSRRASTEVLLSPKAEPGIVEPTILHRVSRSERFSFTSSSCALQMQRLSPTKKRGGAHDQRYHPLPCGRSRHPLLRGAKTC